MSDETAVAKNPTQEILANEPEDTLVEFSTFPELTTTEYKTISEFIEYLQKVYDRLMDIALTVPENKDVVDIAIHMESISFLSVGIANVQTFMEHSS